MDLTRYQSTLLEDFVDNLYIDAGIFEPSQLNVDEVACAFGIEIVLDDFTYALEKYRPVVYLDKKSTGFDRWLDFIHEFCHLLRHAGNQLKLPKLMSMWQEADTLNFSFYATMPSFMIYNLTLPRNETEAVSLLADTFKVDKSWAYARLMQIQRRFVRAEWERLLKESSI